MRAKAGNEVEEVQAQATNLAKGTFSVHQSCASQFFLVPLK